MHSSHEPIRALHVLGTLNRGGIETWLMHVLRSVNRQDVAIDLILHSNSPGEFGPEAEHLGVRIFHCPYPSRPLKYAKEFRRIVQENGPYDVVHSHMYDFSGFILYQSAKMGIPVRIAHSHTDRLLRSKLSGRLRGAALPIQRRWLRKYATVELGASNQAALSLFDREPRPNTRREVLLYGIDLEDFGPESYQYSLRRNLGLEGKWPIIGHVGRFDTAKNQTYLLDVLAVLRNRGEDAALLLVGDGPLRESVRIRSESLGLADRVVFLGTRSDVPSLMKSSMDVFVFPSFYEGLGLVVVEAQAAGLASVITDMVPEEVEVVSQLVTRLPLMAGPEKWAEAARLAAKSDTSQESALAAVKSSAFNIGKSIRSLTALYHEELAKARAGR